MRSSSKSSRSFSCDRDRSEPANPPEAFFIESPFDHPFRLERAVAQFSRCHTGESRDCCFGIGAGKDKAAHAVGDDPVGVIERVDVSLQFIKWLSGTAGASEMERGFRLQRGDHVVGSAFFGSSQQFPGGIGCALCGCFNEEPCQQHDSCNCKCRNCCEKHALVIALHRLEQQGQAEKCQSDSCRPGIFQDVSSKYRGVRHSRVDHESSRGSRTQRYGQSRWCGNAPARFSFRNTRTGYAFAREEGS